MYVWRQCGENRSEAEAEEEEVVSWSGGGLDCRLSHMKVEVSGGDREEQQLRPQSL